MSMCILNKWGQTVLLFLMLTAALPGLPVVRAQESVPPTAAQRDQENSPASTPPVAPQVAADVAPTVFYYHHDAAGNLMALSDENAQVVWRADMQPFGQGMATSTDHPLRFVDQPRERDIGAEDGLYHLKARVYDPLTGRFLSADPLSIAVVKRENPQRFNRFSYALNNPYRFHDASGLQAVSWQEQLARVALRNFINFVEAKLGPNPSSLARASAFAYGPLISPNPIIDTNNQPIRNRAGQEVDLDWGARLAGIAVGNAMDTFFFSSNPKTLAARAKQEARRIYNRAKDFWNAVDWVGEKLGGKRQTGPRRPNDPNILGVDLLIDYIVFGGDLRDYFDPTQIPAKPAAPKKP